MKKRKGRGASVWIRRVALFCVQFVALTMTGPSTADALSVQNFVAVAPTVLADRAPRAVKSVAHRESGRSAGSGGPHGLESPPEPAEPAIWRGPPGRRPHAVEGCLHRAPRRSRTGEGRHPLLSPSTGSFESGRQFTWDDLDQLSREVDSSTTNTYVYNVSGERTHKRRSSLETVYVNQYYTIRSGLFQTKHIYAGATRVASSTVSLSKAQPPTPGSTAPLFFYYHTDHLGSTGYTTGASGNLLQHDEYFPGGEVWFEEVANGNTAQNRMAYLFNAKELDETGLYYYGARYYNPRSGVWVSPDPILDQYVRGGPNGGVFTSGNLGLYTYTWNNPVVLRDPDGSAVGDAWYVRVGKTLAGIGYGALQALTPGGFVAPSPSRDSDFLAGQAAGQFATGAVEMGAGVGITGGGVLAEPATAGASTVAVAGGADLVMAGGLNVMMAQKTLENARIARSAESSGGGQASEAGTSAEAAPKGPSFDKAREAAFEKAGMTDPAKIEFSKVDPKTGTVVEFKGPGGAKVGYDGPHPNSPGAYHDQQHISVQSAGKRGGGGATRENIPYSGPQHPSRPSE